MDRRNLNYMPFSYSERKCPSDSYVLLVSKLFIVNFNLRFSEVLPVHNGPYKANECGGLTIRNGLWLRLRRKTVDESKDDGESVSSSYFEEEENTRRSPPSMKRFEQGRELVL